MEILGVSGSLLRGNQQSYAAALAQHASAMRDLQATTDPAAVPVSERLKALRSDVEEARGQSVEAGNTLHDHKLAINGKETRLSILSPQLSRAREDLAKLEASHAQVIRDPDCDHDILPQEYERLQAAILSAGLEQALVELEQRARHLDSNIQTALGVARDGFVDFINEYSIGLAGR